MNGTFFFERGKFLFDSGETDPFSSAERSKSEEHSAFERSKSLFLEENENSQKLKKNEENQS